MIYDRHEDIAATTKRHPAIVRYRTGVMRDGTLVAQDVDVVMDGGAYCTLTPVVLSRGVLHAGGPYRCADVRIRGRAMATNTPPNGAFRGFGAPQTEFAAEMQANRVADALGMSPLALRRRWVYQLGDMTPDPAGPARERGGTGGPRPGRGGGRVRADAGAHGCWVARGGADGRRARQASGIGLALAWHGAGFTGSGEVKLQSVVHLELDGDGRPVILMGSTEMGQGTKTIFPQLVAAELGIGEEDVDLAPVDTSRVPDSGPTVASRTAMVVGGLVIACRSSAAGAGGVDDRPTLQRLGRRLRPRARTGAHRAALRAVPGHPFRRRDLHRRCVSLLRLGGGRGRGGRGPGHRRGRGPVGGRGG